MLLLRYGPVVATLLLLACAGNAPQSPVTQPATVTPLPLAPAEVVHTARYTLVNLAPDEAQQQPLHQIMRHTLTSKKKTPLFTRADALRAWLTGTGYSLCLPTDNDIRSLFSSPLPDVWRNAGPMRVDVALQAMAGPAWQMSTDELAHTVCFQPVMLPPGTVGDA
ncbi:response regulator [Buttiauxella selenatireducens]|uniref:Response regulator n=1 Tax=Buttiauxella selenatireducens TaxID=3073902 RepID=A0ABY9S4W7_9ENTR|nr:response regulator [Buttiauxella sp. R73]WMY72493.1 response regulator [Buttiauxella sp. R73]